MAARWHESDGSRRKRTNGAGTDGGIALLGQRQKQLVRIEQLRELGLGDRAIQHRAAGARLFRVHRGVFALHPPPFSDHQRYLAAVFACGPGSLLSDLCAAHILGMTGHAPRTIHITNATGAGRQRAGLAVHRRSVESVDASTRHGVPCTAAARTILDCAGVAGRIGKEHLIMAADSLRILDRSRLEALASKNHGRPGTPHVLALVTDDPAETRSVNERRLLAICRAFGVEPPKVNFPINVAGRRFYADFCWPNHRLIVEADSWRWHGGRQAGENDTDRDQLLSIAGWVVVHFTRDQIKHDREGTGHRLLALTRGRSGQARVASRSRSSTR